MPGPTPRRSAPWSRSTRPAPPESNPLGAIILPLRRATPEKGICDRARTAKGAIMYQTEIEHLNERIAALGARVVELEDKVNFLMLHEPTPYVAVSAEEKAGNEAAVVELLKKGKNLEALKLY